MVKHLYHLLLAGDPDLKTTEETINAAVENGAVY